MTPSKRYDNHKQRARRLGIGFNLTFEEWWSIWSESGKYSRCGTRRADYHMARFGDIGNYEVGNVRIITCAENCAEQIKKGARNGYAKLTEIQVRELRAKAAELGCVTRALAEYFGICSYHARDIVKRKKWSHVE